MLCDLCPGFQPLEVDSLRACFLNLPLIEKEGTGHRKGSFYLVFGGEYLPGKLSKLVRRLDTTYLRLYAIYRNLRPNSK